MTKRERERITHLFYRLYEAGFSFQESDKMRLISKTLSRWSERECNGEIERDETTGKPLHMWEDCKGKRHGSVISDLETCAIKRLVSLLSSHPGWDFYHQGDPRGVSLYLYKHDDVIPGVSVDCSYSSIGIAIY